MVADAQGFARGQIARLDRRIEKQNSLAIHEHSPSAGRTPIYCQRDMMEVAVAQIRPGRPEGRAIIGQRIREVANDPATGQNEFVSLALADIGR